MHTFQPFPIDLLEINPFLKIGKEWALVTAGDKKKANTMTVSWGGVGVLWGKNVAYIFIRDSRYTKEFIDKGDFFSVSFLESLSPSITRPSGRIQAAAKTGPQSGPLPASSTPQMFLYPLFLYSFSIL